MEETKTKGDRFTVKSRADHDDCVFSLALAVKYIPVNIENETKCSWGINLLPTEY